ncbi:ABC transporter substrate-binding protein [Jidongwangia harbinensis]|uniref:ABC transporter substrate-binding protein n=1 Tax=Jidongwangia harbinensis TaxID=2878561 RepID=UPI001CD99943|nr:ABC transporter substrate-binding protein [Jidongwangia harbinensis]MCA2219536.1 ABC transporter substrate-binding protein [Jidongwangia harbinensis]
MRRVRPALTALGAATVMLVSGCAQPAGTGDTATGSTDTITVNEAIRGRLPESVRERGTIQFATDPSYAPMESFAPDGRTIIGFDADLAAALGSVLGIKIEMVPANFSTALDETAKGTYDGVLSSITDTVEREKRADFINYFSAGTAIVVRRGNPTGVTELKDLCGQVVAVEESTTQEDLLKRSQKGCAGRPIVIRTYKTNSDALLQLRTGRAVAILNDYPPAAQLANDPSSRTHYQLASTVQYEPGLYGIAVAKSSPALRDALHEALRQLMQTGVYQELLLRWGLTTGALQDSSINGAGVSSE